MIHLLPGKLFRYFAIDNRNASLDSHGRPIQNYTDTGEKLKAVLADATPVEREQWQQVNHMVTHTITQPGKPSAKEGDRLRYNDRVFYIQGVVHPGDLGIWTIYYAEERSDLNGVHD